jgi:hypothetical protein
LSREVGFFFIALNRKTMTRKLLLLSILFFFGTVYCKAGTTPGTGIDEIKKSEVSGGVFESASKKPLANVVVSAYSNSKKEKVVVTDANGNYSFDDLKPGTYKFVFEKEGFKKVTREKTITKADEGCQLTVHLEEHAQFDFMPGSSLFDFED